ncbi:hypothetical protein BHM03_00025735 [Ensete ventricosum]|nr:hypothetical protein BHM03_00025735 [Ensete ventricosum]
MQDEGATKRERKRRELPFPKTEPSIRKIRGKYVSLSPEFPYYPWGCIAASRSEGHFCHFIWVELCMGYNSPFLYGTWKKRVALVCFVWCCWVCGKVIDPPQRVYRVGMLTRKIEEGTAMERAEAVAERPAMARRTAEGRPHDGADEDDDAPHEEAVDVL